MFWPNGVWPSTINRPSITAHPPRPASNPPAAQGRVKKVNLGGEATVELLDGKEGSEVEAGAAADPALMSDVFPGLKALAEVGGECSMPELSTAEVQALEYWGASYSKSAAGGSFTVTPGAAPPGDKSGPLIQRYLVPPPTAKVPSCAHPEGTLVTVECYYDLTSSSPTSGVHSLKCDVTGVVEVDRCEGVVVDVNDARRFAFIASKDEPKVSGTPKRRRSGGCSPSASLACERSCAYSGARSRFARLRKAHRHFGVQRCCGDATLMWSL